LTSFVGLTHVQCQPQQLGAAFDRLTVDDFGNAQVNLGKVVYADGGGQCLATRLTLSSGGASCCAGFGFFLL
jgi:hypothetical protein